MEPAAEAPSAGAVYDQAIPLISLGGNRPYVVLPSRVRRTLGEERRIEEPVVSKLVGR
jgi:hypothetical protein